MRCADAQLSLHALLGDLVYPVFTINNTGNVAIRGLQVAGMGDLNNITCQPGYLDVLPVNASLSCQAIILVSQADIDNNRTTWGHSWMSENIVTSNTSTGIYMTHTNVPPLGLVSEASLALTSTDWNCYTGQYYHYSRTYGPIYNLYDIPQEGALR